MTEFGESFKKARQARGISLDQIALETKISTRFLNAIENEEFEQLPGGIFNRGFVRSFAERVGLDPDKAVSDYERLVNSQEPNDLLRDTNPVAEKVNRHLYPIAIAALALLIIIFYIVSHSGSRAAESTNEVPAAQPPPAAPAVTTPPPAVEPASVPGSSPSAPATPPATPEPIVLEFQARETTWIRVGTDGVTGGEGETLEPGTSRRFTARNSVDLTIGNAGGITLKINGQEVQHLGRPGQVREFTVTAENIKEVIAGTIR